MSITRRTALATGAAAITTAAVTAPLAIKAAATKAALAGDAVLLARCEQFHDLHEAAGHAWEKHHAHQTRIEAMPDCPVVRVWHAGDPEGGPPTWRERDAFLEAHGAYKYRGESNSLWNQTGALAKAIFETPAMTWRGAVEKFKIAQLAIGNHDDDGDEALEAYQDWGSPWMATVAEDFERLIGGLPS